MFGASHECERLVVHKSELKTSFGLTSSSFCSQSRISSTMRSFQLTILVNPMHTAKGQPSNLKGAMYRIYLYPNRSQAVFRFVDGNSRGNSTSSILSHFDRSANRPPGLVKQAYSAYVNLSVGSRPRKWHLTAYFTYTDLQNLPTIDSDPRLRNLQVPSGIYRSGKARSRNSELSVDTSPQISSISLASSSSSSPPSTPQAIAAHPNNTQGSYRPEPPAVIHMLPPLHTAVPRDGTPNLPRVASPQRETRWSEDQRLIQMLNSRHVR